MLDLASTSLALLAIKLLLQVQESQDKPSDELSAEPSYSSYGEAADATGGFANAEASTAWTDASSQCADDDNTAESLSSPKRSAYQQPQRQLVSPVSASQHDEPPELLGSESYISAASVEDDSHEVFSSPAHSPAKQPTATSPELGAGAVAAGTDTAAPLAEHCAVDCQSLQESPAAVADGGRQQQEQDQQSTVQQDGAWKQPSSQYQQHDSTAIQQQHQPADADLADMDLRAAASAAEAEEADAADASSVSSTPRHKRSSSSEQVTFGPILPRFELGGFLGQWDSSTAAAARPACDSPEQEQEQEQDGGITGVEASCETADGLEQGQDQPLEEHLQQLQDPGSFIQQDQQLQQRKLQPLNFGAVDSALHEQHAMTDALWASLRTVEVPNSQQGNQVTAVGGVTSPSLPPLHPRPPSTTGTAPGPAAAAGTVERASSSESEGYGQSAFPMPDIPSADAPGTPRRSAAAAAASTGHSRQASRARSGSGSLLGDWPSLQSQPSIPSDSAVLQQRADTSIGSASVATSARQCSSPPEQERQQEQPAAHEVLKAQQQEPKHAVSALSDQRGHAAAQQPADDKIHLPETAEPEQQQQPSDGKEVHAKQAQQQPPDQLDRNTTAQQHLAVDLLQQPILLQQQQQIPQQPVGQPQQQAQQQPHNKLQEQQHEHIPKHQEQPLLLLQSESTLPAPAGSSPNAYHTNSLSRKQQQYWKQQLQQGQQQRLSSIQLEGQSASAVEPGMLGPATGRQPSKSQVLHTAETSGLQDSQSGSRPNHQQLLTQAANNGTNSTGGELDPLIADLALGLTAPRNWRPSRGYPGSMVGTTHSKLSVMTTAADGGLQRFHNSLQQQQQQLYSAAVPSGHEASSSSSNAAAVPDADGPWFRLVVSSGPAAGRSFHTRDRTAELVIGRSPLCWASISDQEISGKHACVSWSSADNCWQVADAGSLNGTSHNGAVISDTGRTPGQPVPLKHGDRLELGSITSAVVECGSGHLHDAVASQQQQQQGRVDDSAQTAAARDAADKQHQQGVAGALQEQQQAAKLLQPSLRPQQQQQQPEVDSRYSTWAAGHSRPTIASPSSNGDHRSSLDSPAAAAAAALYRSHAAAGASGNGSYLGSSSGGLKRSSLLQTHYRTGGGLSSAGSSSCHGGSPSSPGGGVLAPLMLLQFLDCRIEGAVVKMVGADHRRNQMPCEDVVAWRTPLAHWPQVGLFCVFDGHHSRNASEQAQDLLPKLLSQHLQPTHQQQQDQQHSQHDQHTPLLQQQQQGALLANEPAVAAALTASFLDTDKQLTCEDGCTATALLLEGCADGSVMLRVANVGDSMAVLVDLANSGWRCLTEDHRIAGNASEAARLSAKNHHVTGGVSNRLYGLNIARMLGDRFLKEQDVGFIAEPYVSEGVVLGPQDEVLVLVASDGLWDVVSQERAAGMAGKIVAERSRAAGATSTGSAAVDCTDSSAGSTSSSDRAEGSVQGASRGNSSVAAAVAEALMHAALSLRSKDDISIMVLHVQPAAMAGKRAAAGSVTVSGSI
eukprot:GHUV01012956.1.p1 GENE.GHUV01012956.1~~GHUV01012956.1.p1  ORF type:complete len:1522 (+),score=650.23 GHUV01012956.1:595-5160(+)